MDQIFDLCYYSNGGFTHDEIYNMPSSKREYYLRKLIDTKKKEEKSYSESKSKMPRIPTVRKTR